MPFAYYNRLSPARQRIYRKSDAIEALALPAGVDLGACVVLIREGLAGDDVKTVRRASQQLVDALVTGYGVPRVRIRVLARRPVDGLGELHGLYEPEEDATCARITVWMRTAQRQQVVAFKSYLRTVIHELCHHLDYELFKLPETVSYRRLLQTRVEPRRGIAGASADTRLPIAGHFTRPQRAAGFRQSSLSTADVCP
jgi:hypothetical protein